MSGAANETYGYDENGLRVEKTQTGTSYSENFNDGNIHDGYPTNWYTTDDTNWNSASGELKRLNFASAQCSNPDLTSDAFEAEFDLMADSYNTTNYWAAFAFRKTNYSDWYSTSGYMVYYRYNGKIHLYRAGHGDLASSNTGKDLSTWRHVKVVASGSNIKVYVDGNLEINYNDGTYTGGYFGFFVNGLTARFDNLSITHYPRIYYIRDVAGNVLAEYDGGGNLLAEYIYANGQRMAKVLPNGDVHYYLNDHLGSARALLGTGWSANYYPYGEIASQSGSTSDTHFDFTGH